MITREQIIRIIDDVLDIAGVVTELTPTPTDDEIYKRIMVLRNSIKPIFGDAAPIEVDATVTAKIDEVKASWSAMCDCDDCDKDDCDKDCKS